MSAEHFLISHLYLFRKTPKRDELLEKHFEREKQETEYSRIRCPKCKWKPNKSSRWWCADCDYPEYFYDACYSAWNTFETRGVCPVCRHLWRWTSCLACEGWSRHEDWYERGEE